MGDSSESQPCETHGVSWDFEVADNDDRNDSLLTNGHDFVGGLLTQPCDDSVEFEEESLRAVDTSPQKTTTVNSHCKSSIKKAADVRSLLYGEHEPDPFVVAQSKRLFSDAAGGNEDAESGGSSSCDESDSECSEDSFLDEKTVSTPIQVRRARNIHRHNEFARSLNLGAFSDGLANERTIDPKPKAVKRIKETGSSQVDDAHDLDGTSTKRRGMIFSTLAPGKRPRQMYEPASSDTMMTTTLKTTNELEAKYPCRSLQIKLLSSELEKVVRNTKLAWQAKSSNQNNYSEARPDADVTFVSPAPILISGSAGTAKTSVVCDTIKMLRHKIDNISDGAKKKSQMSKTNVISYAYVDCASSSGIDVAFVLNSAFRQLHSCYHPMSSHLYKNNNVATEDFSYDKPIRPDKQVSLQDMELFDYSGDEAGESDEDDVLGAEDIVEEQRKQARSKKRKTKARSLSKNKIDNLPSERSSTYHREARKSSGAATYATTTTSADFQIKRSCPRNYDSSPVALFGRALSMLLQGRLSRKNRPKHGRCAFLVLDNAERIQSWKKSGSRNALAQLFKLPNVMGVNLSIIFISRGSLLTYSGEVTWFS
jgi:hypothetical protein